MKRDEQKNKNAKNDVDHQSAVSVATPVVAGFDVSISGRFSGVHRGTIRAGMVQALERQAEEEELQERGRRRRQDAPKRMVKDLTRQAADNELAA